MSVVSEITRLQNAKASLKTAIEGKGVTVPSSTKLDGYADLVDSIQQGGGGDDEKWYIIHSDTYANAYIKQNDNLWYTQGYSIDIYGGKNFYFSYKGEKYYITEIRTYTNLLLSKTGQPVTPSSGFSCDIAQIKLIDGNFYAYFEDD